MRVLACDPGYDRLGIAVLEKQHGKEHLLFSGCITTDKTLPAPDRLSMIASALTTHINTYKPTHVALETLFFSKNVKTAMSVAEARGVLLETSRSLGCTIVEYTPQEVKVAVTGYGKSDKDSVMRMVKQLIVGVPEHALDDEYDAIAVGLTALASIRPHIHSTYR